MRNAKLEIKKEDLQKAINILEKNNINFGICDKYE